MGVDAMIYLTNRARVNNVANVIGCLAGCEKSMYELQHGSNAKALRVKTVEVKASVVPECADIFFEYKGEKHRVMYHFEAGGGGRCLLPRSTPFWCAVGFHLVEFFGGKLHYQDWGFNGKNWDYVNKKVPSFIDAEDDKSWQKMQDTMFSVQPLTDKEIRSFKKLANET